MRDWLNAAWLRALGETVRFVLKGTKEAEQMEKKVKVHRRKKLLLYPLALQYTSSIKFMLQQ